MSIAPLLISPGFYFVRITAIIIESKVSMEFTLELVFSLDWKTFASGLKLTDFAPE